MNWIDDDCYCGFPTARVNGFAIVLCQDDDDVLSIQIFDEKDEDAMERGEMYDRISGFEDWDDMFSNAEYQAFGLASIVR